MNCDIADVASEQNTAEAAAEVEQTQFDILSPTKGTMRKMNVLAGTKPVQKINTNILPEPSGQLQDQMQAFQLDLQANKKFIYHVS